MMPRFPSVIAVLFYSLAFVAARAVEPVIPDAVTFERDIPYADAGGARMQLNLARPKNASGPLPVVLCIHGGGFRAGNREGYNSLCLTLAQRGFAAVTISYRLAPTHLFPAAIHDTKAAVRWIRANATKYGMNPDRVGVTGSSAGGHLAQFLGVTAGVKEFEGMDNPGFSSAVTCVVNVYGPSDFTQSYGKSVDAHVVLPLWLGGDVTTARAKHIQSSPLNWVTPNAAPSLIIHGTEDKYVAYEQGVWMRDRLTACGVPVELLTVEGAGHGFKGADAEKAEKALVTYFEQRLKK